MLFYVSHFKARTQIMDLAAVPFEISWQFALNMDPKTLASYCTSSKKLADICRSNRFWQEKYRKDFPDLPFDQRLLDSAPNYYTVNGLDYRRLYQLANLLDPEIVTGRRELTEILNFRDFDPARQEPERAYRIGTVAFLAPVPPFGIVPDGARNYLAGDLILRVWIRVLNDGRIRYELQYRSRPVQTQKTAATVDIGAVESFVWP
jgi:hypothetical protein